MLAQPLIEILHTHERSVIYAIFFSLLAAFAVLITFDRSKSKYPLVNHDSSSWTYRKAKLDYVKNAQHILRRAAETTTGPFRIITDAGPLLMLPPEMIDSVNAEDKLSFNAYVRDTFLSTYSTFRTFRSPPAGMFEEAVLKGITRALPKYTRPLSQEMSECLKDTWGDDASWKETVAMNDILHWVARLSNRIFLGSEFVDNKDWLRITTNYTTNLFIALFTTKLVPSLLRPLVDLLSPLNRKVRSDYRQAAVIIGKELSKRDKEIDRAERDGDRANLPDDAIEWFRTAAHGRQFHQIDVQLGLAVAAIHTTSDLLCQAMLNLCSHPETVQPLRQEIITVLNQYGLQKQALTELRLLDSFLKETQRLKPIAMASMHRSATADVVLPGDVHVKKGEHIAISSHRMWDEAEYKNADSFNAWRYVDRRRMPGYENKSLLVSTSPDHLGFAHGKHACPGRFFAANEVKLAMLHLLMKYDMKIELPTTAKWETHGANMMANTKAKIHFKKRTAEIDLDSIAEAL